MGPSARVLHIRSLFIGVFEHTSCESTASRAAVPPNRRTSSAFSTVTSPHCRNCHRQVVTSSVKHTKTTSLLTVIDLDLVSVKHL